MKSKRSRFMKIKNIIWDFDGTIMDTYPAIATSTFNVAQKNNIDITYDEILRMTKITLRYALEYISDISSIPYEKVFQEYLLEYDKFDISTLTLFPFVKDVLEYIVAQGGKNYIITHRGKNSLTDHLNQFSLSGLFAYSISGDCGFTRKPEPDAFIFLKEKYDLSPSDTVVVGDRILDVKAGYGAGFMGILYQNSADFEGKLIELNDYSKLLKLIKENE